MHKPRSCAFADFIRNVFRKITKYMLILCLHAKSLFLMSLRNQKVLHFVHHICLSHRETGNLSEMKSDVGFLRSENINNIVRRNWSFAGESRERLRPTTNCG